MNYGIVCLLMAAFANGDEEPTGPNDVGCFLKQKDWIEDEYLLLTWGLPMHILRRKATNLQVDAGWSTEWSFGPCSEVTLTSCKMIYGESSSPASFDIKFNLTVTINTGENATLFEWFINSTFRCRQPPSVGYLSADALNSSCIDVRWGYTTTGPYNQRCFDRFSRYNIYNISYRKAENDDGSSLNQLLVTKDHDVCYGRAVLCGLTPYTVYEVRVECKTTSILWNESSLWSQDNTTFVETAESVPTDAPAMTTGGFSYKRQDCNKDETRLVTVYWKTLPKQSRQGRIQGYKIQLYISSQPSNTLVDDFNVLGENSTSFTAPLMCSLSYFVLLQAFTLAGISEVSSSIFIHKDTEVLHVDVDVIPELQGSSSDILISCVFHSNISFSTTNYSVFWCLKTLAGQCQSPINWFILSPTQQHYVLKAANLSQPIHKYMIGISLNADNRSSGIIWSRCLYTEDKDVMPPRNVRFRDTQTEGALQVEWDNPSCDTGNPRPYVMHFIVYICALERDTGNNCSGSPRSKEVKRFDNSALFSHMEHSDWYGAYVVAVTRSKISQRSIFIRGKPYINGTGFDPVWIPIIAILSVVLLGIALVGFYSIYRHIYKTLKPTTYYIEADVVLSSLQQTNRQNGANG